VNCLAPTGATQMMEGILPAEQLDMLRPELVSPAVLALVADGAPTRAILCAGAGSFEVANITLTQGIHVEEGTDSAEEILARWPDVTARDDETVPGEGFTQARHELAKAGFEASESPAT